MKFDILGTGGREKKKKGNIFDLREITDLRVRCTGGFPRLHRLTHPGRALSNLDEEKMSKLGCVRIDVTSRTQSFNKSPGNTQRMERFGLPRQLDAMLQELRCHFQSELRASIDARRTLLAPVAVGTCGQTTTEEMPYARDSKQNMRLYSISSGIE